MSGRRTLSRIRGAMRGFAAAGWLFVALLALPPLAPAQASGCYFEPISGDCIPYPYSNGPSAQTVVLHFAAIAISPTTLSSGCASGQNSLADADDLALHNCSTLAKDCKVVNGGSNLCFALAVSLKEDVYWQDYAPTRAQAAAQALAGCAREGGKSCYVQAAPCAGDDARWPSPLPLPPAPPGQPATADTRVVGTWLLSINPGVWIWQIAADGTYQFHSQAGDGAPSHAGVFTASGGKWTLRATNGLKQPGGGAYTDGGTYTFPDSNTMVATGRLGTGTWHRSN
jgi:Domain of unknown function (DUF4189)